MSTYLYDLMRWTDHMGRAEWLIALAAVIFIGILCLRGIGARSHF
jgi:hypothetical protein